MWVNDDIDGKVLWIYRSDRGKETRKREFVLFFTDGEACTDSDIYTNFKEGVMELIRSAGVPEQEAARPFSVYGLNLLTSITLEGFSVNLKT